MFLLVKTDSFIVMLHWYIKKLYSNANLQCSLLENLIMVYCMHRIPGAPNYTGGRILLYKGYIGYVPTFEGDLTDYNATFGFKNELMAGSRM